MKCFWSANKCTLDVSLVVDVGSIQRGLTSTHFDDFVTHAAQSNANTPTPVFRTRRRSRRALVFVCAQRSANVGAGVSTHFHGACMSWAEERRSHTGERKYTKRQRQTQQHNRQQQSDSHIIFDSLGIAHYFDIKSVVTVETSLVHCVLWFEQNRRYVFSASQAKLKI